MTATVGPAPGTRLGPYRLEAELGQGAVGIVFRAVREADGAVVAVKVLKHELSGDSEYAHRFEQEARAARSVTNRHLVPVLDAGQAEGRHYLVSRHVPGRSLQQLLDSDGPLPLGDTVALAAGTGAGLDALHAAGLVHRDIKPANILLDPDGRALLTDFGLAKGPAYTVLTKPGQVLGTLDYLAPELISGGQAGPPSDIYALGCVVYACATGQPPFADRGMLEIGIAHLREQPPDPRESRPEISEGLAWALLQALAKDPEGRPPSATAYAHMLRMGLGRAEAGSP